VDLKAFRRKTVRQISFLLPPFREPDESGWDILESVFAADKQIALTSKE